MQEERHAISAYFITLTYDTSHVPISKNGFMDCNKRDLQLFFKRLRKAHGVLSKQLSALPSVRRASLSIQERDILQHAGSNIKYYAVGEYGGRKYRSHYHAIIFNAAPELIQNSWICTPTRVKKQKGKKRLINCTCGKHLGEIFYGSVTGASVGYTLKYMSKVSRIPMHKNDDRQQEFALMSKGLGSCYLTKAMQAWHMSDKWNRMYVNLSDGRKIGMPRYYKNKIYTEDERKTVGIHTRQRMLENLAKYELQPQYYRNLGAAKEMLINRTKLRHHQNQKL